MFLTSVPVEPNFIPLFVDKLFIPFVSIDLKVPSLTMKYEKVYKVPFGINCCSLIGSPYIDLISSKLVSSLICPRHKSSSEIA